MDIHSLNTDIIFNICEQMFLLGPVTGDDVKNLFILGPQFARVFWYLLKRVTSIEHHSLEIIIRIRDVGAIRLAPWFNATCLEKKLLIFAYHYTRRVQSLSLCPVNQAEAFHVLHNSERLNTISWGKGCCSPNFFYLFSERPIEIFHTNFCVVPSLKGLSVPYCCSKSRWREGLNFKVAQLEIDDNVVSFMMPVLYVQRDFFAPFVANLKEVRCTFSRIERAQIFKILRRIKDVNSVYFRFEIRQLALTSDATTEVIISVLRYFAETFSKCKMEKLRFFVNFSCPVDKSMKTALLEVSPFKFELKYYGKDLNVVQDLSMRSNSVFRMRISWAGGFT